MATLALSGCSQHSCRPVPFENVVQLQVSVHLSTKTSSWMPFFHLARFRVGRVEHVFKRLLRAFAHLSSLGRKAQPILPDRVALLIE